MMSGNSGCAIYIGNLDERVSERVLYDILIQAGRVADLYIPRDKETNRSKGYAFAEYETEETAEYAVKLFSGLVTLYNRTLRFAISGQDKASPTVPLATPPISNSLSKLRHHSHTGTEVTPHSATAGFPTSCRFPVYQHNGEVPVPPGVTPKLNGYRSHYDGYNYDYSRRVFGATVDSINRSRSGRYGSSYPY